MTGAQKKLIGYLVKGYFLRRIKHRSKKWYVLYDPQVNPIIRVRERTVDSLDQFVDPKFKIWRYDRNRDQYFDLRVIRQLHGNTVFKRAYKTKDQVHTGSIYKSRQKKAKKLTDEKVYSLF